MKFFKNVRQKRDESLLDILGLVAKAKKPVSLFGLKKVLGRAYSNMHKNTAFLERKGFLVNKGKAEGRKKKLYDITIKGALASLYSWRTSDHLKLLAQWKQKEWEYCKQPFKNIKDVSELRKFVEILYMYGSSLEEIDEGLLRRGLRNPEEAVSLIVNAALTIEEKIKKDGTYNLTTKYIPRSVAVGLLKRQNGTKKACFIVMPDEETGQMFSDFFSQNPTYKRKIGEDLLAILKTIASDLAEKDEKAVDYHYFPNTRRFIVSATLSDEVASLVPNPKQVLNVMKDSYGAIIRAFHQNDSFVDGSEAQFIFQALKYDPNTRNLSTLSKDEVREKALSVLEKLNKQR